jgi:hypothetical protein
MQPAIHADGITCFEGTNMAFYCDETDENLITRAFCYLTIIINTSYIDEMEL